MATTHATSTRARPPAPPRPAPPVPPSPLSPSPKTFAQDPRPRPSPKTPTSDVCACASRTPATANGVSTGAGPDNMLEHNNMYMHMSYMNTDLYPLYAAPSRKASPRRTEASDIANVRVGAQTAAHSAVADDAEAEARPTDELAPHLMHVAVLDRHEQRESNVLEGLSAMCRSGLPPATSYVDAVQE